MEKIKNFFFKLGKKIKENGKKLAFWFVLLVVSITGFFYSFRAKNDNNLVSGSADEVIYNFEGSYFLSTFSHNFYYIDDNIETFYGEAYGADIASFKVSFTYNDTTSAYVTITALKNGAEQLILHNYLFNSNSGYQWDTYVSNYIYNGHSYTGYTDFILQSTGNTFINDVVGVRFGYVYADSIPSYYNFIEYFDDNGSTLRFLINNVTSPVYRNGFDYNRVPVDYSLLFSSRTYYLNTYNPSNSEIYQDGYNDGYARGERDKQQAVNDAYNQGKSEGYNLGRETPTYSFISLLDAVGYSVTKPFASLLNFDLLGTNLLSLATGFISLVIIVKIIGLLI